MNKLEKENKDSANFLLYNKHVDHLYKRIDSLLKERNDIINSITAIAKQNEKLYQLEIEKEITYRESLRTCKKIFFLLFIRF